MAGSVNVNRLALCGTILSQSAMDLIEEFPAKVSDLEAIEFLKGVASHQIATRSKAKGLNQQVVNPAVGLSPHVICHLSTVVCAGPFSAASAWAIFPPVVQALKDAFIALPPSYLCALVAVEVHFGTNDQAKKKQKKSTEPTEEAEPEPEQATPMSLESAAILAEMDGEQPPAAPAKPTAKERKALESKMKDKRTYRPHLHILTFQDRAAHALPQDRFLQEYLLKALGPWLDVRTDPLKSKTGLKEGMDLVKTIQYCLKTHGHLASSQIREYFLPAGHPLITRPIFTLWNEKSLTSISPAISTPMCRLFSNLAECGEGLTFDVPASIRAAAQPVAHMPHGRLSKHLDLGVSLAEYARKNSIFWIGDRFFQTAKHSVMSYNEVGNLNKLLDAYLHDSPAALFSAMESFPALKERLTPVFMPHAFPSKMRSRTVLEFSDLCIDLLHPTVALRADRLNLAKTELSSLRYYPATAVGPLLDCLRERRCSWSLVEEMLSKSAPKWWLAIQNSFEYDQNGRHLLLKTLGSQLFIQNEEKKKIPYLYGEANSGKSSVLDLYRSVFQDALAETSAGDFSLTAITDSTLFLLMEEFKVTQIDRSTLLLLLEHSNFSCNKKQKDPVTMRSSFGKALNSNDPPNYRSEAHVAAIMARCELFRFRAFEPGQMDPSARSVIRNSEAGLVAVILAYVTLMSRLGQLTL